MLEPAKSEYVVPSLYPAKGHYFALSARAPFKHLIYPMPTPDALGIHLTLDISGGARFGPDILWQDDIDYAFVDVDARREIFAKEIKRYWPALPEARSYLRIPVSGRRYIRMAHRPPTSRSTANSSTEFRALWGYTASKAPD